MHMKVICRITFTGEKVKKKGRFSETDPNAKLLERSV